MRFLLVNNHCLTDPTAGVTRSLRTIMTWLAQAGHVCEVLTTSRFETPTSFTIDEHLAGYGVPPSTEPVVAYTAHGLSITLLRTQDHTERQVECAETRRYKALAGRLLEGFEPDVLIACNAHAMIQWVMAYARARGVVTAFAVRGHGYTAQYFEHADHAFTCSQFMTDRYRQLLGLSSTPLEPPIEWRSVLAPEGSRAFVTFVHPSPHKGLYLFARIADVLNQRRPDIPLLIVQSGRSAGGLNAIPGLDFSHAPQIKVAPPVEQPAEYFALTKLLLVPSVWPECFGRVAAEAMINRIPVLVSDRGALPAVVGEGGRVLPVPSWMSANTTQLPSVADVEPWVDAICTLWDDPVLYRQLAGYARRIAVERYSESVSRARHLDYFTSIGRRTHPLITPPVRDSSPPE